MNNTERHWTQNTDKKDKTYKNKIQHRNQKDEQSGHHKKKQGKNPDADEWYEDPVS